jgi:hypothetical protein
MPGCDRGMRQKVSHFRGRKNWHYGCKGDSGGEYVAAKEVASEEQVRLMVEGDRRLRMTSARMTRCTKCANIGKGGMLLRAFRVGVNRDRIVALNHTHCHVMIEYPLR